MAMGPRDPRAADATGRGRFRASDADREQAIDALKTAFVQGLLSRDELGVRTGRALASRTYAELTAITADIASRLVKVQPPSQPAQARTRTRVNKKAVAWGACAVIVAPALGAAFFTFYGGFLVLLLLAFIAAVVTAPPRAPS